MADNLLTPINNIINTAASTIVDQKLTVKISDTLKSVIDSSTAVVDNILDNIKELTKEK
jgi:hypothetical protein